MFQFLSILLQGKRAEMDERGASAVEYGLLVAGIAAVIVAVVFLLGENIQSAFNTVNTEIEGGGTG